MVSSYVHCGEEATGAVNQHRPLFNEARPYLAAKLSEEDAVFLDKPLQAFAKADARNAMAATAGALAAGPAYCG
jgi:hypothetical protein